MPQLLLFWTKWLPLVETEPSLDGLDRITQPRTWGVFWRRDNGGGGVCCWHLDGPWQVGKLNHWMAYLQLNFYDHYPQSSGVTGQGDPEWWGAGTCGHLEIRYNSYASQIQSQGSKKEEKEQANQLQEMRGPQRLEEGWLGCMPSTHRGTKMPFQNEQHTEPLLRSRHSLLLLLKVSGFLN